MRRGKVVSKDPTVTAASTIATFPAAEDNEYTIRGRDSAPLKPENVLDFHPNNVKGTTLRSTLTTLVISFATTTPTQKGN